MIVGRVSEQQELLEAYKSPYSQFVAVYGRRRVGKTFLVNEVFGYKFTFHHAGLAKQGMRTQINAFYQTLLECGMPKGESPKTWLEAFSMLSSLIKGSREKKKVIFLDEAPWMDTPKSGFTSALEYFWNQFASGRKDVLLIICGSATSWIINKVLRNHGGLHNRVTHPIHLRPFTLKECETYLKSLKISASRDEILEGYMVMGGVPYYWSLLDRRLSMAQNIDELFFSPNGKLHNEFYDLYDSLFRNPDKYIDVVKALKNSGAGLSRDEIISRCKLKEGGNTTRLLSDLQECGFIRFIANYPSKKKEGRYQLMDNYTIFYFRFQDKIQNSVKGFWVGNINSPVHSTWAGLAFERVCTSHIQQIKSALGISGVETSVYGWQGTDEEGTGAQIDMLIDRSDMVINLCEIKYGAREYSLKKKEFQSIQNKIAVFREKTRTRKSIRLTLITNSGLARNSYWGYVQNEITSSDLFAM